MGRIIEEVSHNASGDLAGMQHPKIKLISALIANTRPNPNKLFVIEGIWAHKKALQYNLEVDTFIYCTEFVHSSECENIIKTFTKRSSETLSVSKKVFLKVSERENPDGILSLCKLPNSTLSDIELKKSNLVVVLDGLEIPGNVGTIIRSVDGVGADGVILCNRKVRLTHPKLVKASQGSNFTIPVVDCSIEETIEYLCKNNYKIYLTDTRAEKQYYEEDYSGRVALIAGSERYGIDRRWYDITNNLISIPMYGDCDSLNVAIATTIFLYEASLNQKGMIKR